MGNKSRKRKAAALEAVAAATIFEPEPDTRNPAKLQRSNSVPGTVTQPQAAAAAQVTPDAPSKGRHYTVSMAVPGSVIDNAQTTELATLMAGQIARTAAIFNVDEVVVIDDARHTQEGAVGKGAAFLARVLQFMETPQYLRKALIPMHKDLRLAGMLPPLDAPHHMRASEWKPYREGVILSSDPAEGSLVDVGLDKSAHIPQAVRSNVRVTVDMGASPTRKTLTSEALGVAGQEVLTATITSPSTPREVAGLYWGFSTRIASGLSAVLSESPFKGGYDLKVGTSEHGTVTPCTELQFPKFQHLLIAFGGPQGLELCMMNDRALADQPASAKRDPRPLFDMYVNTCPNQGSRTIRTEEAVLISMAYFQPAIISAAL